MTEPTDWAAEVSLLFDDLARLQTNLLAAVREKRAAMTAGDFEAMAQLEVAEQECSAALAEFRTRRQALLARAAAAGFTAESLTELVPQLVPAPAEASALKLQARDAAAQMQLLNHECLANWVVAQLSWLHTNQLLEIVFTRGRGQPTYGDRASCAMRGSLVNQQV